MIKKLLFLSLLTIVSISSCKKEGLLPVAVVAVPKTSAEIVAPSGFTWQNSRNVNLIISITDAQFQGVIHAISIYDKDPTLGGQPIVKGSATTVSAFRGQIYLSSQISELFIVCADPTNKKVTQKVPVKTTDISVSISN